VADFRVEQNPEAGLCKRALRLLAVLLAHLWMNIFGWNSLDVKIVQQGKSGWETGASSRQEGNEIGDGFRLHERGKALKGKPHEWIWYEIRPVSERADEGVRRLRKPEDARDEERHSWSLCGCPPWRNTEGDETLWEESQRWLGRSW